LALAGVNVVKALVAVRGQAAGANASGWTMVFLMSLLALAFLWVA